MREPGNEATTYEANMNPALAAGYIHWNTQKHNEYYSKVVSCQSVPPGENVKSVDETNSKVLP